MYSHYEDEVNKKRKLRAPPVRAYGTRNAAAEEALNDLEAEIVSNKRRRSAGDDEGKASKVNHLSTTAVHCNNRWVKCCRTSVLGVSMAACKRAECTPRVSAVTVKLLWRPSPQRTDQCSVTGLQD